MVLRINKGIRMKRVSMLMFAFLCISMTTFASELYVEDTDAQNWGLLRIDLLYLLKTSPHCTARLATLFPTLSEEQLQQILDGKGFNDMVEYFVDGYYPPNGEQKAREQDEMFLGHRTFLMTQQRN